MGQNISIKKNKYEGKRQLQPDENSSLRFIIEQSTGQIVKCDRIPKVNNFMVRKFHTAKLCGDTYCPQNIVIACQHYVKCTCTLKKCFHQETSQYSYNHVATTLVNYLEDPKTQYPYWVSGDCYVEFDHGYMTPEHLRLFIGLGPDSPRTSQ